MMKKDIVDIITEKSYNELNQTELDEIREFCSDEEEFDQMKDVFVAMQTLKPEVVKPSQRVKDDLDALFEQQHPKAGGVWYANALAVIIPKEKTFFQQPLVRIAAILLIVLMVYPFVNNSFDVQEKSLVAEVEKQRPEIKSEKEAKEISGEKNDNASFNRNSEVQQQSPLVAFDENLSEGQADLESAADDRSVMAGTFDADHTVSRGFEHPDGIFAGAVARTGVEPVPISVSAGETPKLLDLLTATF